MSSRRISKEDKGKGIALEPHQPPRTARIKARAPEDSERLKKLSLTLIGRATNQSVQKVWSLIPFFTELWKNERKPIGSDLGNGMFQFQFDNEADLLAVLDRRPYHYARWMVIVQRWEPTVSDTFPSLIPFWISIQGVPLHLWSEELAESLGNDIGIFEKAKVTALAMKMRVQINGRLPLIKTAVIEYANGDEVNATFVYEKLERHCSKCCRLDHELKDCLVAKHQERALKAQEDFSQVAERRLEEKDKAPMDSDIDHYSATNPRASNRQSYQRHRSHDHRQDARDIIESQRRSRSLHEAHPYRPSREFSRERQENHYFGHTHNRGTREHYHREGRSRSPQRSNTHRQHNENRENRDLPPAARGREITRRDESSSSKNHRSSSARGIPLRGERAATPPVTFNEALEEVRETMVQYTQCADPSESAARRERARLAEEKGEFEEAAALIVKASAERFATTQGTEEPLSADRVPVALRLGPMAPPPPAIDQINETAPTKRKPGRPPGSKKIQSSPKMLKGATSKKRKFQQSSAQITKKKTTPGIPWGRTQKGRTESSKDSSKQSASATVSENQPICKMIPISARRKVDFQNPSSLGP